MNFWLLLRFRWKLVASVFLVIVGTAVLSSYATPHRYSLIIQSARDNSMCGYTPDEARKELATQLANQISSLRSKENLERAIDRLNLGGVYAKRASQTPISRETVIELLNDGLSFDTDLNDQTITVTAIDQDRKLAGEIATQIAKGYYEIRARDRRKREEAGLETLREQLAKMESEVATAKAKVEELRKTLQVPADW